MKKVRLDQAIEGIITSYYVALDNARTASDETLSWLTTDGTTFDNDAADLIRSVKTIIRADKTRPTPTPPSIWIFPHPSMQEQAFSLKESWNLPIQLTAIVKDNDPLLGNAKAYKLAALARSVILQNRNLGLYYVRDTLSTSFSPTDPPKKGSKNLHAHQSLLTTRFEALE